MTAKSPQDNVRYEVITQEDSESGDIIVPIPPHLLKEMNWKEGDELEIQVGEDGRITLTKVNK